MSPLPVSAPRTSTLLSTQRLLRQLGSDQLRLQQQYDRLSSGRQLLRMSDDPVAATRVLGLQAAIDRGDQLVRNAASTASFYQATDEALARVDNALIEARGIAVEAAQSVLSEADRTALAAAIDETIRSVLSAGNSLFRDHQLLGGFLNGGEPLHRDAAGVVFRGQDAVAVAALGGRSLDPIGVSGVEGLGVLGSFLDGQPLTAAVHRDTPLTDLRGGRGVTSGVLEISAGQAWQTVDLTAAGSVGDVIDLLSSLTIDGRPLSVTLGVGGIEVGYADNLPGTLAIRDVAGSSMAGQLSILNPQGLTAPPLAGDDLTPRLTAHTRLADLQPGRGIDRAAGIQLRQGQQRFTIDLAAAETIGDVLIAINHSGADVRAELDPVGGRIRLRGLRSGVDYAVGENGGTTAADLGIRSASADTPLAELGKGLGIRLEPSGADLILTRPDGVELELDLDQAATVGDVMRLIRDHPLNQDDNAVSIDWNAFGSGLRLTAPAGDRPLTVRQRGVSDAAIRLGWLAPGSNQTSGTPAGGLETIAGSDFAVREAGGTLDTLLRLRSAVLDSDPGELQRLQNRLDQDLDRAAQTRGRIGRWSQSLEQMRTASQDNVVRMQGLLSEDVDADVATLVSQISQQQFALEASLRILGQTSRMTVLDFL